MLNKACRGIASRVAKRYRVPGMTREDVEQECILALLEAVKAGETDPSRLFMIARRTITLILERPQVETLGDSDGDIPDAVNAEAEVDERDSFLSLIEGKGLTDDERETMQLHYLDGLSAQEISERLEIAVTAVWARLSSARTKIREFLTQDS